MSACGQSRITGEHKSILKINLFFYIQMDPTGRYFNVVKSEAVPMSIESGDVDAVNTTAVDVVKETDKQICDDLKTTIRAVLETSKCGILANKLQGE